MPDLEGHDRRPVRTALITGLVSALITAAAGAASLLAPPGILTILPVLLGCLGLSAWLLKRTREARSTQGGACQKIEKQNREIRELMTRFYRLMADYEKQQQLLDQQRHELTGSIRRRTAKLVLANRTLEKQDRLKDEFVSLLAHELRTPLTSVRSYVELLLNYEGDLSQEERHEFLGICRSQVRRVTRLTNELLDMSRLRSGKFQFEPSDNNISETAQEVVRGLRGVADGARQTLQVRDLNGSLPVHCDHDRLVQILNNLVGNALKYSPEGSHVTISLLETDDDRVEVDVSDNGPGIAENERELVFEPFYRTRSVGQSNVEGTGLGLYLSRQLARQMGGELRSRPSPSGGASFVLTLPMHAASLKPAVPSDSCQT
ncbi:MAG: HAMP domain-containing sensor histidine kinase [Planctomycetota bacterium]